MKTNTFPKVHASPTKSKFGSASLFTDDGSFNPFDATAPGMTPELSLERAQYAATAINSHAELLEALKNSLNVLAGLATGDLKQITKDSPAIAQARAAIAQAEGGDK